MNKITKVGAAGLNLIRQAESFSPHPYLCPAGVWTIGFGTTFYFDTKKRVARNDAPINIAEGERLLRGHVDTVFAPLADKLCRDDLTQNEFDAVVDFLYNCGATYIDKRGKLQYYNIFHHINERMGPTALREYWQALCVTGGGKVLKGLISRRKNEVDLFLKKN
jgi:lysozyme